MNFFEKRIEVCDKRVNKIKANPDPSKMQSNMLLYELEGDLARAQLKAIQEHQPVVGSVSIACLFRAMGFEFVHLMQTADRTTEPAQCFEATQAMGYPEAACDRTIACIGMGLRGDLPPLSLIVAANFACDPEWLSFKALACQMEIPIYMVDVPNDEGKEALQYVTEQLYSMIEFAEAHVPGLHYDEKKHRALQKIDEEARAQMRGIYELMKMVPSPMKNTDVFRIPRLPSIYPDQQQALRYFQTWQSEVLSLAQQRAGTPKEERLRVLWNISGPYQKGYFSLLEQKGVSVPFFNFGLAPMLFGVTEDEVDYGRELSPVEGEAKILLGNQWRGNGDRWIDATLKICRELKLDAIINFLQLGCTTNLGLAKILSDRAMAELGIPTLHIDGRQMDTTPVDTKRFNQQLEDFIDICLEQKQATPHGA
ncbi:2-hydroxyacyl-CoA dehydratase [Chloroflexota bacterium]